MLDAWCLMLNACARVLYGGEVDVGQASSARLRRPIRGPLDEPFQFLPMTRCIRSTDLCLYLSLAFFPLPFVLVVPKEPRPSVDADSAVTSLHPCATC